MKICYIANSRFPSERAHMTQIVQMCNAFVANGHEVTLLVTDRKTDIQESPEIFFGIPLNFSVLRISVPDIAGRSPKIPVVLHPYLFFIQRLTFAFWSARHIQKNTYSHLYGRDEWILWFISFLTKVSIVWESHEARYSFAARRLLRKQSPLVVISEGICDFYTQRGIARERILVAHDAVDNRFFADHLSTDEAREMLGMKPQKPVAMYIGGLEKYKGAVTFFEATKNQDTFEAYVVGGKENEIPSFREAYPHIHFLGPRPYRELPWVQQAADVLVIPNTGTVLLSALYTSPLKLFSYMTAKKPIVASRIPSITNILRDTEAYFFSADDAGSLRDVIHTVLTHPKEAQEKAEHAYKKSLEYTWEQRAKKILNFLTKLY